MMVLVTIIASDEKEWRSQMQKWMDARAVVIHKRLSSPKNIK
jgi:hypothetical protein